METSLTPFRKIALLLAISIIPLLYYAWLSANPALASAAIEMAGSKDRFQAMSLFEQTSAVIGGFVYKPIHMVLAVLVIWALWRVKSPDLMALRWGLFFFWLGEALCAVNYLVFNEGSPFSEFLHSYGMVVGFAFIFYALFQGLDERLIHFTKKSKKCAASDLCGKCIKAQAVPCGIRRLILLLLPVMLILAMLPLAARLQEVSYQTVIFGTLYTYKWPSLYQLSEARFAPGLAMLLLAGAWLAMFLDRRLPIPNTARVLVAAGFGALLFGTFRFTLKTMFFENLIWADYWEELTELLFVLAITAVLILFKQSLFQEVFPGERDIHIRRILMPGLRPITEAKTLDTTSHQ